MVALGRYQAASRTGRPSFLGENTSDDAGMACIRANCTRTSYASTRATPRSLRQIR